MIDENLTAWLASGLVALGMIVTAIMYVEYIRAVHGYKHIDMQTSYEGKKIEPKEK